MKKSWLGVVLAGVLALPAFGQENAEGLKFWISAGNVDGDVGFEESVTTVTRSVLEWDPSGLVIGFGSRYQFVNSAWPRLSVQVSGRTARDLDGTAVDTDYLQGSNAAWIMSKTSFEGEYSYFDFQAGWVILENADRNAMLELTGGYAKTSYDFDMKNVNTLISNYASVNLISFGDAGSYDTRFKGNFIGLSGTYWFNDHFGLDGSVRWFPSLRADATGKWEFRDLLFKQNGRGDGYESSVGLTFMPKNNWAFSLNFNLIDYATDEEDQGVENYTLSTSGTRNTLEDLGSNNLDQLEIDTVETEIRATYYFS